LLTDVTRKTSSRVVSPSTTFLEQDCRKLFQPVVFEALQNFFMSVFSVISARSIFGIDDARFNQVANEGSKCELPGG